MKALHIGALAAGLVLLAPAVAFAASHPVTIDVGADVSAIMSWARDLLVAVAGIVVAIVLPLPVRVFVTNAMLERAVDYAIAQVDGATKGKTITVDLANDVLNEAVAYVLTCGPKIARQLGDHLKPMLLARLSAKVPLPAESIGVPIAPDRAAGNGNTAN